MALSTYISCFSGAGGLDLAVRLAVSGARCVCHVEIEAAAAALLASRMAEGSLDAAPIWSDARTFDGRPWRGKVGGIIAGFPCPDYSVAGRRAGITGKHGQLWHSLARIIREVEPEWVFLENVPGILNPHKIKRWRCVGRDLFGRPQWSQYRIPAGIHFALGDLAEMGFDAEWGCLSAAAVGASHKRERWWCLAYSARRGLGELRESSGCDGLADGGEQAVGDTDQRNDYRSRGAGATRWREPANYGRTVGNAIGEGLEEWRCERCDDGTECAAAERASVPFFAPGPSDPRWADLLVRFPWLRPALAQAEAQSAIHDDFDGMAQMVVDTRTDALRAAGNGALALAGAAALTELLRRIG